MVVYICRQIWVARCAATFDAKAMRARAICIRVVQRVQLINLVTTLAKKSTRIQENSLAIMGISRAKVRQKRGVWCKWDKPSPGWFKLNIDGSAIGDKITGGGIVRDHHGNFIGGFSVYYGHGTNNLAQFLALRDGLFMCFALNIAQVRVESNSMVAVLAMSSGRLDNWRLEFVFRESLKLMPSTVEIVHGYRQKNQVADRLAAVAHSHKERADYYRERELPRKLTELFLLLLRILVLSRLYFFFTEL